MGASLAAQVTPGWACSPEPPPLPPLGLWRRKGEAGRPGVGSCRFGRGRGGWGEGGGGRAGAAGGARSQGSTGDGRAPCYSQGRAVSVHARAPLRRTQRTSTQEIKCGSCAAFRVSNGAPPPAPRAELGRGVRRLGCSPTAPPGAACEQRAESAQPVGAPALGYRLPPESACRPRGAGAEPGHPRAGHQWGRALPAPRRAELDGAQAVASLAISGSTWLCQGGGVRDGIVFVTPAHSQQPCTDGTCMDLGGHLPPILMRPPFLLLVNTLKKKPPP